MVSTPPEKVFKGKSLDEWTSAMSVERDVSTLIDAMMAVASLVDAEDVVETQSLLVAARRYGGWLSNGGGGSSSDIFMHRLTNSVAPNIMPRPGLDAINNELIEGNAKSRAAALWLLSSFNGLAQSASPFLVWATETGNQALADRLHANLQSVIRSGELKEPQSLMAAKELSLTLAIAMKKPKAEEHELRSDIEQFLSNAATSMSARERLGKRWSEGADPSNAPAMTPINLIAAGELGIEIPHSVAAATFNLVSPDFREELNKAYSAKLQSDPQRASDAMLLKLPWNLGSGPFGGGGIQDQLFGNEKFWIDALPIVTENTTRPDILIHAFFQVQDYIRDGGGGGGMGSMGGGPFGPTEPSEAMVKLITECKEQTRKRMDALGMIPSVPASPPNTGGMF